VKNTNAMNFHPANPGLLLTLALCATAFLLPGCAVHYYDPSTGTENLWGFGHMKMAVQPANEGVRAVINGTQTLGLGLGLGQQDYYVLAGWNSQRMLRVADNTSVRFEWPTADFFNVRVGTNFPTADCKTNHPEIKNHEKIHSTF